MKQLRITLVALFVFSIVACGGDDSNPQPMVEPDYEVESRGVSTVGGVRAMRGQLTKIVEGRSVEAGFYYWEPSGREHRIPGVATLTATGSYAMEMAPDFATAPGHTMRAFIITDEGEEIAGRTVPFGE